MMEKFGNLVTEAAHSLEMGVELKMPDDQYANIPATQTAFSKAAVDRCVVVLHAHVRWLQRRAYLWVQML